jgi:multicopper oxidase
MKVFYILLGLLIPLLIAVAVWLRPSYYGTAGLQPPDTDYQAVEQRSGYEKPCHNNHPDWRPAQVIEGVSIDESLLCNPDNPYDIAAFVKGINHVSMPTLMKTRLSEDSVIKTDDLDGDGDPDIIRIKLEVIELNGSSPDGDFLFPTYDIAPGIQPGMWVFAPKSRGMSVKNFASKQANELLRAPSSVIRVEQGDKIFISLENTHYLPHTIHFHGVDHPWQTASGGDNDGVPVTGEAPVFPGGSHTYELQPRHAGTMFYHCHVQTDKHLLMGLNGLFVVEENRPDNWLQTFNIGAGQVRHSSVAVKAAFDQEYDLHYQSIDKNLAQTIQQANDPRLIAEKMNRVYNMTESSENYFLLNGHSLPYTLRDALIVAKPDQNIKLRIVNAQHSAMALHFHGHKTTVTDYDGVKLAPEAQITRDVFDIAAAQRLDLHLQTSNDGLHSYGPGIWLFHDHVEMGVTTDGMSPGGNNAVIAYHSLVDEQGMPKVRKEVLDQLFNKNFYAKKIPVWGVGDFAQLLGNPGYLAANYILFILFGLSLGLVFGLLIIVFIRIQKKSHD